MVRVTNAFGTDQTDTPWFSNDTWLFSLNAKVVRCATNKRLRRVVLQQNPSGRYLKLRSVVPSLHVWCFKYSFFKYQLGRSEGPLLSFIFLLLRQNALLFSAKQDVLLVDLKKTTLDYTCLAFVFSVFSEFKKLIMLLWNNFPRLMEYQGLYELFSGVSSALLCELAKQIIYEFLMVRRADSTFSL